MNVFNNLGLFLIVFFVLDLCSCAHMRSLMEAQCTYERAYVLGANDAKENKNMDNSFAHWCSGETKADTQKGYREGYIGAGGPAKTVVNVRVGKSSGAN